MTIEETLSRLAINSGRIAEALEALVTAQGIVPDVPGGDEKPEPAKKKASKKKASKKTTKKTVGKTEEPAEPTLDLKEDVRPIMKQLQSKVSGAAVKSLLKKYGASTLPTLEPRHYENIVADAKEQLAGVVDDDDDLDL
jgi:hypothetical protein